MQNVADWLEDRHALTPSILTQMLRMGHFRLFNITLSRLTKLDLPSIDIIVGESGGRTLAVVARGLNIDKSNFVSLFLLARGARGDEQIVHPRELSQALAAFDRMRPGMASSLLQTWRENPSYLQQRDKTGLVLEA